MSKKNKPEEKKVEFALGRENYILLIIGFAIIIFGFLLMIGGKADNPDEFNEKIFRRLKAPNIAAGT